MRLAVLLCGVVLTATGCNGARFCGYSVVRTPAGGCPTSCPAGYPAPIPMPVPQKAGPISPTAPRPFPLAAPAAGTQDVMLVPQVIFVPQAATGSLSLSALGGRVLPSGGHEPAANPQLAEVLGQMRMLNARLADLEARMAPRPEPVLIPPVQDPTPTPSPAAAAAPAAPTATVLPPMPPTNPTWATAPMPPPQILPPIQDP